MTLMINYIDADGYLALDINKNARLYDHIWVQSMAVAIPEVNFFYTSVSTDV